MGALAGGETGAEAVREVHRRHGGGSEGETGGAEDEAVGEKGEGTVVGAGDDEALWARGRGVTVCEARCVGGGDADPGEGGDGAAEGGLGIFGVGGCGAGLPGAGGGACIDVDYADVA